MIKSLKAGVMGCVLALMAVLLGIWAGAAVTRASEEKGSIELGLPAQYKGVEMTAYPVAAAEDGVFVCSGDFKDCGITVPDMNEGQLLQKAAGQLEAYIKEKALKGIAAAADENGVVRFQELSPALYLVVQTKGTEVLQVQSVFVPIPYLADEEGHSSGNAVVAPKYLIPEGAVILNKKDDEGTAVGQAHFLLQKKVHITDTGAVPEGKELGEDDKGRFFWEDVETDVVTDEAGQAVFTKLLLGSYRFVETQAPQGFIMNTEAHEFQIEKSGQVQEVSGVYVPVDENAKELSVKNERTSLTVNKVNAQGAPLSGAKLAVKDEKGQIVRRPDGSAYVFTSSEKAAVLRQLPAGVYYISELEAPEGYQVARDVKVTVSDAKDAVNTVTMVDEKQEKTKGSLEITKNLTDERGNPVAAENGAFYVALFRDEAHTDRMSDVKKFTFAGSSSETVTFKNLALDTVYYVCETDEFGSPVESLKDDKAYYVPLYPDNSTRVEITKKAPHGKYVFENVFVTLPDGYYYEGSLTVTKKVLHKGKEMKSRDVFYAGIFKDAGHTQLYGDLIELDMDGSAEFAAEVPVYVGNTQGQTVTYYVTETDKNGTPLENGDAQEFTFTVDKSQIALSTEHSKGEVTITNDFPEEKAVPTLTPTQAPDGSGGGDGSGTYGSSDGPVRTGDESGVEKYLAVLLAALAAAGAVLYKKTRKGC